jgi:hypothetical protein
VSLEIAGFWFSKRTVVKRTIKARYIVETTTLSGSLSVVEIKKKDPNMGAKKKILFTKPLKILSG